MEVTRTCIEIHKKIRSLFALSQAEEAVCQREMLAAVDSFDFGLLKSPSLSARKLALIYGSVLIRALLDCPRPKVYFEKTVKGPFCVRGQFIYISFDSHVDQSLEERFLHSYQSKRSKTLFYYTVGSSPPKAAIVLGVCEDRVLKNLSSPRFLDCLPDPETTSIFIYFQPGQQYKVYDLNFEWMELEKYKQYHLTYRSTQIAKPEYSEASLLLSSSKHLQFYKTKNFTVEISSTASFEGDIDYLQFNSVPTKNELADEIGSVSTKEDSQRLFDPEVGAQVAAEGRSEPTTTTNKLYKVSRFRPNISKEATYFDRQRDTPILRSEHPQLQVKRKFQLARQSTTPEQTIRKKTRDFSLRSPSTKKQSVRQAQTTAKSIPQISGIGLKNVREHKSLESKKEKHQAILIRFPNSEQKVAINSLSLTNAKPNQRNKNRVGFFLIKPQRASEE